VLTTIRDFFEQYHQRIV